MPPIRLRGASAHNLCDLDLDLPTGTWTALTGPSGSGKTTLAFDVLHREGQRRYLSSLTPKARQALGKLGHADIRRLTGLPVTLATGQSRLTPHARSTVGTLTGLLDQLRLLYARAATSSEPLTRSHFSFNTQVGACPSCKGLGVQDEVHAPLLVADPKKSLRDGALIPTLASGYTVYSQVRLEVMNRICEAHGFDVLTPWRQLTDAQRHMVFYGSQRLRVPFGKHALASRMKWEGITARPREEGYYRGLIPVIEETLKRDRNPNILRFVRTVRCTDCDGLRLGSVGREAHIAGSTLPDLLALRAIELPGALRSLPNGPVLDAILPSLVGVLQRMDQLSLGHLSLDRGSLTLSGGEGQRLRIASQLQSQLGGMLILLDEPTLGLHPSAQAGMAAVIDDLRDLGNTVLTVEHDPHMTARADRWLALGPGAGPHGGRIVEDGPMRRHALRHLDVGARPTPRSDGVMRLRGARLHTLDGVDLDVALGALTVVSGPSGAGKSSLVFQTLLPALRGMEAGPYSALEGVPEGLVTRWVDAKPIGRTPRSTPATYTGIFDLVRKRFAATPKAKSLGMNASRFSYNAKAGRCPACEGLGVQRVGLHLLADVQVPCVQCEGGRYAPEVLDVQLRGLHIAEVLDLSVEAALAFFSEDGALRERCETLAQLGLHYLRLGQASNTLSRGEAQRIKLATVLGTRPKKPSLVVLDEPDRGLHPDDVLRLVACLDALVRDGHTVLAVSHHPMLWQAAHHRVALDGGRRVAPEAAPVAPDVVSREPAASAEHIELLGVRTHNLRDVDLRIRHGAITAVTGPSGSGKSSLVFHSLAAEAWRRFAESLPFQVRRHVRQLAAPSIREAKGLTPVLALEQRAVRPGPRSTVGTLADLDLPLRVLWSREGRVDGVPTTLTAAHFSPNQSIGACETCAGLGTKLRCDPELLIRHPSRPLRDGAMDGTRPGAFFGEPDGQAMATLAAAAAHGGLELSGPWESLSAPAQALALWGSGEHVFDVEWAFKRGKREGTHHFRGPWMGLCSLVEREARIRAKRRAGAEWAAPLVAQSCATCSGERLSTAGREVEVDGLRLPDVRGLRLDQLQRRVRGLVLPEGRGEVLAATLIALQDRLEALVSLGLGHLSLGRRGDGLSGGELQRVRLAGVLCSALSGLTLVLDEPGTGLHDGALDALGHSLRRFCDEGNTVVLTTHRESLLRCADEEINLGPGAGPEGGRVQFQGPPRLTARVGARLPPIDSVSGVSILGAHLHGLGGLDVRFPNRGVVAVTGPSGAGKSTLLFDVLGASVEAGRPRGCVAIAGHEALVWHVMQRDPPRSAPLAAMGLLKPLQALFHGLGSGLPRGAFSFHSAAGGCPGCRGAGRIRVPMDVMADVYIPCELCEGKCFRPEVLRVRWKGRSVADVLAEPVAALLTDLPDGAFRRGVERLVEVGLGHVELGRDAGSLSGGERQRLLIAAALAQAQDGPGLMLLDEPGRGLSHSDLERLLQCLGTLATRGCLVVMTTHRRVLIDGAHARVALGGVRGSAE